MLSIISYPSVPFESTGQFVFLCEELVEGLIGERESWLENCTMERGIMEN